MMRKDDARTRILDKLAKMGRTVDDEVIDAYILASARLLSLHEREQRGRGKKSYRSGARSMPQRPSGGGFTSWSLAPRRCSPRLTPRKISAGDASSNATRHGA